MNRSLLSVVVVSFTACAPGAVLLPDGGCEVEHATGGGGGSHASGGAGGSAGGTAGGSTGGGGGGGAGGSPSGTGGGASSELTLAWDWSTSTGNSMGALLDTSKPTPLSSFRTAGNLPLLNVTPATGLGFPASMTNVLSTTLTGTQSSDVRAIDLWPAPQPGESLFFRLYVRYEIPDSYGNLGRSAHHPIQPEPGSCPLVWQMTFGSNANGTLDMGFAFSTSGAGFSLIGVLRKSTTYRFEWAFHRQTSGTYKVDIRIYDGAGALVADDARFISQWNPDYTTPLSMKDPDLMLSDACIRRMMIGYNGPSWPEMNDAFARFGGWAVRLSSDRSAWLGAYP